MCVSGKKLLNEPGGHFSNGTLAPVVVHFIGLSEGIMFTMTIVKYHLFLIHTLTMTGCQYDYFTSSGFVC